LLAAIAAGCGGGSADDTVKIESITPAYAPLSGGTRVVITGQGFLRDGAPPNRVVIGGLEAPLASASDDASLEVETPPGEMPGDVDVVVFNRNGQAVASSMFHYSTPPTIVSADPRVIQASGTQGTVTITGSGFQDENAGTPAVTLNGESVLDLTVVDDTHLTFTPRPQTTVFAPVEVTIANTRGSIDKPRAFFYAPTSNASLILFSKYTPGSFGVMFDLTTNIAYNLPAPSTSSNFALHTVYLAQDGNYYGFDNANRFGQVDFAKATLVNAETVQLRIAASVNANGTVYVFDRNAGEFGTFDQDALRYTPILSQPNTCGHALAVKGTTLIYSQCYNIGTIDAVTGNRASVVPLAPNRRLEEIRYVGNTLYALEANGGPSGANLYTLDPMTGATTLVKSFPAAAFSAMEVFQP
jgi:hypothetical protein